MSQVVTGGTSRSTPALRRRLTLFVVAAGSLSWHVSPEAQAIDFATARFSRRLQAVRASNPIRIDGILEEDEWRDAPRAGSWGTRHIENRIASSSKS